MAFKISDISGYTKFINTKFVDDIKPVEEPTIDAQAVMGAYTEEQSKEASERWHDIMANAALSKNLILRGGDIGKAKKKTKKKTKKGHR